MENTNLEIDLRSYCKNQNSDLFSDKIYDASRYLASSICLKYKIPSEEIEETILEMVAEASIKLPEYYDDKKGMAKNMLYIIMKQYLLHKFKFDQRMKRDKKKLVFIEDLNDIDINNKISKLIEVEIDELELQKNILLNNSDFIIERLEKILHKKIAGHVIECIKSPEKYITKKGTKTFSIAKKCKTNMNVVRRTLSRMNEIVSEIKEPLLSYIS